MSDERKIREGRVWAQFKKFEPYKLILLGTMSDLTRTRGALTPSRRPSKSVHGEEEISDVLRGSPDLPGFSLMTRLERSYNYLLGLKKCRLPGVQGHLGKCKRPDNFYGAHTVVLYSKVYDGDMSLPTLSQIEGDDAKIEYTVPFSAINGPIWCDMLKSFLSARTITEAGDILDMYFFGQECVENCESQEDAGENGYLVTDAYAGSPTDFAYVYYTEDKGDTWAQTSAAPFAAGEDISAILVAGITSDHRVIVFRGTADGANPAECAYADVTAFGTTTWNTVNIGAVNGQYITGAFYLDDAHVLAVTNDGYVYLSDDGGVMWTAKLTTATNQLNGVALLDNGFGFAVGADNTLYITQDGAESWSSLTGPSAGNALTCVWITPDGTAFIGDDAGGIYGTYDRGDNFTTLALQGATAATVKKIKSYIDDNIFVIANKADGEGLCWESIDGGASFRLWALNMPTNSGLNALSVVDQNLVFVGGDASLATLAFLTRTNTSLIGIG
jgi:hypothetical protein